ncbi:isoprenylcysteine carboxylmethyltransferase family protein [Spirosoma pollinicola]|uniref:Isoprenylcysteine carboxylmethyltransferase family protein n=1 Tax=Spirosoma pollinicola TaxID=2057025 RepID=A0A2K8Z0P7_9BACT|nr:isoprenylcysteine carboxylmethyltransferase family protein [Spirosoma pollinicola]
MLFGATLLIGLLVSYAFPTPVVEPKTALVIGLMLLIIGVITLLLAFRGMIQHKTTIHPKGATTAIVRNGLYRYTRNPMYLSLTLIYLGVSVAMNAWWGLLLLIPLLVVVQKGIVEREEQYLIRKFGQDYLSYKAQVRRWL